MSSDFESIEQLKRAGMYRKLQTQGARVDFSSNDYLGLAHCPDIRKAMIAELKADCPLGATGSRLLSGNTFYHERVESFLGGIFGGQMALLFSSGFMANLGLMVALGEDGAEFFSDEYNHASLIDGLRLTKCRKSIFRHGDMSHLEGLLAASRAPKKIIVIESVFSMDGDLAPLNDLVALAVRFEAWLVVDEAHATGVFGDQGLGRLEGRRGAWPKLISVHTAGKALGGQGAFIIAENSVRELLINRARSFIYSTALAPLSVLQIEYALKSILAQPHRGSALLAKARRWRAHCPDGLIPAGSDSQIIPVITGSSAKAVAAMEHLQARGFQVRAIRSPTVPIGTERLRITLKSDHREEDLRGLLDALAEWQRQ